jgi:hypothetical protein
MSKDETKNKNEEVKDCMIRRMKSESCDDENAAKLADAYSKVINTEAENRKNKNDFWGSLLNVFATVIGGVIAGGATYLVAKTRANAHINAIDHVAFYEDNDVIFTGKKFNEIGKIE